MVNFGPRIEKELVNHLCSRGSHEWMTLYIDSGRYIEELVCLRCGRVVRFGIQGYTLIKKGVEDE